MNNRPLELHEWLLRPVPFGLVTTWLILLIALFVVQALLARDRGDRPWWDAITTSVVVVCTSIAVYFAAFTANYARWAAPTPDFYDINRVWMMLGAAIGLPLLATVLVRDTMRLIRRRHRPIVGHRVTVLTSAIGEAPDIRVEVLRAGDFVDPAADPVATPEVPA